MYLAVDELIANVLLGEIQELSVQELVDEESKLGSVPPSLCSWRSDASYTNEGNEVNIDSPVNFVGFFNCSEEPSSILAE